MAATDSIARHQRSRWVAATWMISVVVVGCGDHPSGGAAGTAGSTGAAGGGVAGTSGTGGTGPNSLYSGFCPAPDGAAMDALAGDAGSTTTHGDAYASGCPVAEPTGGACATEGLRCGYGDGAELTCRREWHCLGGTWQVTDPCATTTERCPAQEPTTGDACGERGHECSYPSGTYCGCALVWGCGPGPKQPGCPLQLPFEGGDCTGSASCTFGNCLSLWIAQCCRGTWVVGRSACVMPP